MATVQASPLAVVTQPFSLTLLGSEADLSSAPSAQPTRAASTPPAPDCGNHGGGDLLGRWISRRHLLHRRPQCPMSAHAGPDQRGTGDLRHRGRRCHKDDGYERHRLTGRFRRRWPSSTSAGRPSLRSHPPSPSIPRWSPPATRPPSLTPVRPPRGGPEAGGPAGTRTTASSPVRTPSRRRTSW